MIDETQIRELLVASCHSSKEADVYFMSRLSDPELLDLLISIAEVAKGANEAVLDCVERADLLLLGNLAEPLHGSALEGRAVRRRLDVLDIAKQPDLTLFQRPG